jgi:hypothetical protein
MVNTSSGANSTSGGNPRDEAERDFGHDEQNRVGNADDAREHGKGSDADQQTEDDELEVLHDVGPSSPRS